MPYRTVATNRTADDCAVVMQQAATVTASVNHPRLHRTDPESIRTFLKLYDQHKEEVLSGAEQITGACTTTNEAARPINIKYCVDPDWLESLITLGFIDDVTSIEALTKE